MWWSASRRIVAVWLAILLCGAPAQDARAADPAAPLRIVFIGNSYTYTHDIPGVVRALAVGAGFPDPLYATLAAPGWTLATHRASSETRNLIDLFELDVVVLQEQSQRPTNPFQPAQFKADATWLYDRIKAKSPDARVILYETWARAPGDAVYPRTYANPAAMQAQLRHHYLDAATTYIPSHSTATRKHDVTVAPVGDAWEHHLAASAIPLHDPDLSHPNFDGAYLAGLVLFSTIYQLPTTTGLPPLGRNPTTATTLQSAANAVLPEPTSTAVTLAFTLAAMTLRRRNAHRATCNQAALQTSDIVGSS